MAKRGRMKKKDIIALTVLFVVYLYLFTLPLQETSFPFGEGDAAHKFGLVDYMVVEDVITKDMPFFYAAWYAYLTPDDFYAPPNPLPFFIGPATVQAFTPGDRFSGTNFYFAFIAGFTVILAIYFLARKLFGFWVALLAGLFLIFPGKTVLAYIWGQRPHNLALSFVPMAMYCLYKYLDGYAKGEERKIYLILYGAFVGLGAAFHLQSVIPIGIFTVIYSAYILVKTRKFPYNIKTALICTVVVLLIVGPHLGGLLGQGHLQEEVGSGIKLQHVSHLFHWFKTEPGFQNREIYTYPSSNGGWWTLPLLLVGLGTLLLKRKKQDNLVLFFLITVYIGLHLHVFNLLSQGRVTRIAYIDAQVFALLIAIGLIRLPNLIGLKKQALNYARIGLVVIFIILLFNFNFRPTQASLSGAYPPIARMTPAQYEVTEWLRANIPEDSIVYSRGQLTYPKARWMHMLSHRSVEGYYQDTIEKLEEHIGGWPERNMPSHVMIDYSDYMLIRNQEAIISLQELEEQFKNETIVYDKNNIKVYEIES